MTRSEIEAEVRAMLARLQQPDEGWTLDAVPRGDGTPHVEGNGPAYTLVVDADGAEVSRETMDGYEVVYQLLRLQTRRMAMACEQSARKTTVPGWIAPIGAWLPGWLVAQLGTDTYSRSTWIDAHCRLMDHLRGDWGARVRGEHEALLRRYPLTRDERENFTVLDLRAYGVRR
ncbi:hypothetical protein LGQ03_02875 [Loktanella sp. TSTF-M6]|uniref:Immunity protein 63 of polymorphic toxin system n=1 Tax=Loktanella gaetbuli TaxID=2881335 RepID=A0ABS8BR25_9RHOB|nr:hypothetical protein [Loktanella gaetbuli]MCB5198175.1 hypothetical protein [Loktanella gaetbuli]